MITDDIQSEDSGESYTITLKLNSINAWKCHRWIDLMNAYDTYRKSANMYNKLIKEIAEDYDKDFKEGGEESW